MTTLFSVPSSALNPRIEVFTPSIDTDFTLPTTGIFAGQVIEVFNRAAISSPFPLINIKANGTVIDRIYPQTAAKVVALVNNPVLVTDWAATRTGMVGEVIESTNTTAVTITSTSGTNLKTIPITTTGVYLVSASVVVSASGDGTGKYLVAVIASSAASMTGMFGNNYAKDIIVTGLDTGASGWNGCGTMILTRTISAGTTLYLNAQTNSGSTSCFGYIQATRIA